MSQYDLSRKEDGLIRYEREIATLRVENERLRKAIKALRRSGYLPRKEDEIARDALAVRDKVDEQKREEESEP